jgi:hypothetical protein
MLNSIKNISRLSEKTSSRSASSIIAPASTARTTGSARSSHRLSRFHRSINPDRVFGTKVLGAKSRSGWCAHLGPGGFETDLVRARNPMPDWPWMLGESAGSARSDDLPSQGRRYHDYAQCAPAIRRAGRRAIKPAFRGGGAAADRNDRS